MADPAYIVDGVLTDGEAWVGLATTTLASDTASVTFTSTDDGQVGDFSQYVDLCLIAYYQFAKDSASWGPLLTWLNGNTTYADYVVQRFYGSGSAAAAAATTGPANGYGTANETANANKFCALKVDFFDINSGKYKSAIGQNASDRDGAGNIYCNAWTFKSQAPVSSILINESSGDGYTAGSMFSLFGVLPRMVA
jgi:hypothetical protein